MSFSAEIYTSKRSPTQTNTRLKCFDLPITSENTQKKNSYLNNNKQTTNQSVNKLMSQCVAVFPIFKCSR